MMMALLSHGLPKLLLSFCTVKMASSFYVRKTSMNLMFNHRRGHLTSYFRSGHDRHSTYRSRRPAHTMTRLEMTKSPTNYYQSATSLAQFSSDTNQSYPTWWPGNVSKKKYMALMDHIVHVIVPDATSLKSRDGALTCLDMIQLVLDAANQSNRAVSTTECKIRPDVRIDEWREGEKVSNSTHILDPGYRHDPSTLPEPTENDSNLNTMELLALGSVWYLPIRAAPPNVDRFDPSSGIKPRRMTVGDWNTTLSEGDYLRVHFDPRRFCETNKWNWGCSVGEVVDKPGVIVARNDEVGYMIIDKPPNVPVHARVDNLLENVASSIGRVLWTERKEKLISDTSRDESSEQAQLRHGKRNRRKQKMEQLLYVATPQRLDQNTTGLLVVATKKSFAAYFAKLLRTKTTGQLNSWRNGTLKDVSSSCGIHKTYKCLICIMQSSTSMVAQIETLQTYARESTVIRHYLEPSIKSRKVFHAEIPYDIENKDSWAECLLRITSVENVCTVVGNQPSEDLAKSLWGRIGRPAKCIAVAELQVELLTGRTHQIRGQFAALGFPLVGDAQYGGAVPSSTKGLEQTGSFLESEKLVLQCSTLRFLNPCLSCDSTELRRSDQWLKFSLDQAFWSPFLRSYVTGSSRLSAAEGTSSIVDRDLVTQVSTSTTMAQEAVLPPRVSLSIGSNKYVIIKAIDQSEDGELLFVRSASPEESGPNHANVAEELLCHLKGLGLTAYVTGGGRIDYIETNDISHAHVYGFSYGFGKGDHQLVASLIEENTGIVPTFDNSDGLY